MMKNINKKNIALLIGFLFVILPQNIVSQVSKYQSIEKVVRKRGNIVNRVGKRYRYKKDKSIRLVFSDRDNNNAYLDPYGQKKGKSQSFLTPYFVINSRNGFCELVEADSSLIGKPKGLFSCFMNKKYHFTDTKSLKYIGWLPLNNLIEYPKALTDAENNRPLKYKIGFEIPSLFELLKYFNKDSLTVYKDPFFKIKSNKILLTNQVVYPYKYDLTKKAVFVSTGAILKDTVNQVSGWIPSNFIFPIGHNRVLKLRNNLFLDYITEQQDTIYISSKDIYSKYLYEDLSNNIIKEDSLSLLSVPIYVWNHLENKIINVDGEDIFVSEIDRFKNESKVINFHFIFNQTERSKIKLFINSLQNVWMFLSKQSNLKFSFSAICTGKKSFVLNKTNSFVKWLDFMQKISNEDFQNVVQEDALNVAQAIKKTLSHKSYNGKNFENNFFIVAGNREQIALHKDIELIKKMANKSSSLLFVQMNNGIDESYQNYILRAKESMALLGNHYNSFIRNYTVDNNLIVTNNSLKNIESKSLDNIYVYDTPKNSRFNGGIIFPKINKKIDPLSLSIAINSILVNIQKNNELLLSSLEHYKSELSVLRSKPTSVLQQFFSNKELTDSLKLSNIDRNNIDEVFYKHFYIDNDVVKLLEEGYILNKDELLSLIENYRMLLLYFSNGVSKKERKILKKMYKNQIKGINSNFKRKVLSRKSTIGKLFYYKAGFPVTDNTLNKIHIKHLKRNCVEKKYNFSLIYLKLIEKLNLLEEKFSNNQLERTKDNRYYIPKEMLL